MDIFRKFLFALTCFVFCAGTISASPEKEDTDRRAPLPANGVRAGLTAGTVAVGTAVSRVDVMFARSLIVPNHLKGDIGEAIAENVVTKQLKTSGGWKSVTPRIGRQGLDQIFIKTYANGYPRDLMVGESKFGSSKLGQTKDGVQMSSKWTNKRLRGLGTRYTKVSKLEKIELGGKPPQNSRKLSVFLKNGKEVFFWSKSSMSPWKFAGTQAELAEARKLAGAYGKLFESAGRGVISYRSRIFLTTPDGNDAVISIFDAKNIGAGNTKIENLPKIGEFTVKNAFVRNGVWRAPAIETMAKELKKMDPTLTDRGARKLARESLKNATYDDATAPRWKVAAKNLLPPGVAAVGIAAGIDIALQWFSNGRVDGGLTALNVGAAGAGFGVGVVTNLGIMKLATKPVIQLARALNCSVPALSSALSSTVAGVVVSAIISYGAYFLGCGTLKDANRSMIAGVVGVGAGAAVGAGVTGLVAAYGTAGTGVAISSLSGATATNATLAWLGGGTLAAGGGGVALGTVVLTGGVAVVAVAVTVGVSVVFDVMDARTKDKVLREEFKTYSQPIHMDKIVEHSPFGRAIRSAFAQ